MELIIASQNLHKIREFRQMLKGDQEFDLLSLLNFPEYSPPEESGATFEENAIKKAVDAAQKLGKWVFADDSGLVVPSLGGAPGVYSRRYAGSDATDAENRHKLLQELQGKKDLERSAYFHCTIVLANPIGDYKTFVGTCEGMILEQVRGGNGFGYDPIFLKHGYDKSFAELDETTKNRISHRRKAVDKLLMELEELKTEHLHH